MDAALIGGVDLIAPLFSACAIGDAGSVADVLAGRQAEARGLVVRCGDGWVGIGR